MEIVGHYVPSLARCEVNAGARDIARILAHPGGPPPHMHLIVARHKEVMMSKTSVSMSATVQHYHSLATTGPPWCLAVGLQPLLPHRTLPVAPPVLQILNQGVGHQYDTRPWAQLAATHPVAPFRAVYINGSSICHKPIGAAAELLPQCTLWHPILKSLSS